MSFEPEKKLSGNTPTCVGKTLFGGVRHFAGGKHPHVRGEDQHSKCAIAWARETPPRAWGRRNGRIRGTKTRRNTPTCVGKTTARACRAASRRKHPHVRGEDRVLLLLHGLYAETPPRAWGRPVPASFSSDTMRNTPTCVGKTCTVSAEGGDGEKHPHVRGEDPTMSVNRPRLMETPPRAWGRPFAPVSDLLPGRNTPTCVGKTCAH